MKESGKVININDINVTIEVEPQEACTKCCSCNASKKREVTIKKTNETKELKIGDNVEVEINTASMLKVYFLIYGCPLVVFVSSLLVVYSFIASPIISFVAAIGATIATYLLIGRYMRNRREFLPTVCPKG